ncbi:hypothetical protein CSUI_008621, partial [Cystoisospora suis]
GKLAEALEWERVDGAISSHPRTRAIDQRWREYDLPPVRQASYPDVHTETQVILSENQSIRIEWRKPRGADATISKKIVVHPGGYRMLVEVSSNRESIEIESEKHCHIRITLLRSEEPLGDEATPSNWKVNALLQGAEGTKVSVSCRLRSWSAGDWNRNTGLIAHPSPPRVSAKRFSTAGRIPSTCRAQGSAGDGEEVTVTVIRRDGWQLRCGGNDKLDIQWETCCSTETTFDADQKEGMPT